MNETLARFWAQVRGRRGDRATLIGAAVSAGWLLLVAVFWLAGPSGTASSGLGRLAALVGVVLPLVLVWIAVGLARAIAELRAEALVLRARMEALRPQERAAAERDAALPGAPGLAAVSGLRPAPPRAIPRPDPGAGQRDDQRQSDLPLEQPRFRQVSPDQLVAALDFPDGPDDHAAIAALRAALADPEAARSIRAAQDVLTLLARHELYADDLAPARVDTAGWRRFLDGQRGGPAPLATIADAAALEAVADLMREDELFRDSAHHFLRQFDRALARVAPQMDDALLAAATETRSGRAFRLLAQVTGMFA